MGLIASRFAFLPPTRATHFAIAQLFCQTSSGVYLPILYYPYPHAHYTIVFAHGNATDVNRMNAFFQQMALKLKVSVVAYEYVGYGHSYQEQDEDSSIAAPPLAPSEQGCYESAEAAADYVTNTLHVPLNRQIWFGESIGSGPTVYMVSRLCARYLPVAAMILVSPFWSATSVVSPFLAAFYDMFPNGARIGNINVPTLIIHGKDDSVVPPWQSECLQAEAQNADRVVVNHADHNTIMQSEQTWAAIKKFLNEISFS